MPRFFFHLHDGHDHWDADGVELADLTACRRAAARLVGQFLRDHPERFWESNGCSLRVTDAEGDRLFSLSLLPIDAHSSGARLRLVPPFRLNGEGDGDGDGKGDEGETWANLDRTD